MAISEFEVIQRYFQSAEVNRNDVVLGIGDDCALLKPPADFLLATSTDTLVSGVHFFPDVDPESLGHKALAVNLSDLAAMGANPAWVTLALSLPHTDEPWLAAFSRGFARLAKEYGVQLVGGDTTRGPLSITVQVTGFVSPKKSLRRDAACSGDLVYVTGVLGDAALALQLIENGDANIPEQLMEQLQSPTPRVKFGQAATSFSSCAIDISDGLLADLGHIAKASDVGVQLEYEAIPVSSQYVRYLEDDRSLALSGGDDYEIVLTVKPSQSVSVEVLAQQQGLKYRQSCWRYRSILFT